MVLFGLVGVANTLIDFAIYNLLTGKPLRWPRLRANLVSGTCGMGFSFVINLFFVFPPEQFSVLDRVVKFALVSVCSLYVVQSAVIYCGTNVWTAPVALTIAAVRKTGLGRRWDDDVLGRNLVKAWATGYSLV